jgi:hypothetical protein
VRQGELQNTTAASVELAVNFEITNVAAISGRLGPVTFQIVYEGSTFITATIPSLTIARGVNEREADGVFQPPDAAVDPVGNQRARDALSRYLRRLDTAVTVRGGAFSTPNALLRPAMANFSVAAQFPGATSELIINATLFPSAEAVVRNATYFKGQLAANNTLAVDLRITDASLFLFLCDSQSPCGTCQNGAYSKAIGFFYSYGNLSERPVFTPAKRESISRPYNITFTGDAADLANIGAQTIFCQKALGRLTGNLTTTLQRPAALGGSAPFGLQCFYEQFLVRLFADLASNGPDWGSLQLLGAEGAAA